MPQPTMLALILGALFFTMASVLLLGFAIQRRPNQEKGIDFRRPQRSLGLWNPSDYTRRGRRYLYRPWLTNIIGAGCGCVLIRHHCH